MSIMALDEPRVNQSNCEFKSGYTVIASSMTSKFHHHQIMGKKLLKIKILKFLVSDYLNRNITEGTFCRLLQVTVVELGYM